ncbi:MAG: undecaprenyl-diphosphate phosphatase [Candidatus Moranbacteria bacterium]|jgi:undecaprenyl-diphosphatase|nr:undecaprenyl-diphosphate phosphatase [Candidatus Moranbacteria bacterium]
MIDIFQSIFLGIIQGASEFLPISSSGHLIIIPEIFGWREAGLYFDVSLHFGTLLAVVAYFWRDWMEIISLAFGGKKNESKKIGYTNSTLWILAIATIPGVLAGFFLESFVETIFRNQLLVAFNLFFWGGVLFYADKKFSKKREFSSIGFVDGILIGLSQMLAVIPGTSRSGITITAGLMRGLGRVGAARFSFLMMAPIVFGASFLKFGDFISNFNVPMLLGVIFSAISGIVAINLLLKFVERISYQVFFWYRAILAFVIVFFYFF